MSTRSIAHSALPWIAGAALLPGVGSAIGGLLSKIPGAGAIGGALGGLVHGGGLDNTGTMGLAGDLWGMGQRSGLLPGGGNGAGSLIPLGLAGAEIANAAETGRKADRFANAGWDLSKGNWDANDPLRTGGRARMLNATGLGAQPFRIDTGGLDAIRGQIPGGLPAGGMSLNAAASALGGGGGATPPLSTPTLPSQPLVGGGPPGLAPTAGRPGFRPQVKY